MVAVSLGVEVPEGIWIWFSATRIGRSQFILGEVAAVLNNGDQYQLKGTCRPWENPRVNFKWFFFEVYFMIKIVFNVMTS